MTARLLRLRLTCDLSHCRLTVVRYVSDYSCHPHANSFVHKSHASLGVRLIRFPIQLCVHNFLFILHYVYIFVYYADWQQHIRIIYVVVAFLIVFSINQSIKLTIL